MLNPYAKTTAQSLLFRRRDTGAGVGSGTPDRDEDAQDEQ